jgi:hypothetical protein
MKSSKFNLFFCLIRRSLVRYNEENQLIDTPQLAVEQFILDKKFMKPYEKFTGNIDRIFFLRNLRYR